MEIKRSSTPPPSHDADQHVSVCPETPVAPRDALPRTMIPPSPGGSRLNGLAARPNRSARIRAPPASSIRSQTAGVKKPVTKTAKIKIEIIETETPVAAGKKTISFMNLPGEIRNLIYSYTAGNSRQALLVYRPRLASLRSRTRLDRQRTLKSDVVEEEQDRSLATINTCGCTSGRVYKRKSKTALLARETNRPFFGLTQVCRLLRQEFRPIYMQRQEIGMDLLEVVPYLETFYPEAAGLLKDLSTSNDRKIDMPFTGNFTIAVGDKVKEVEKSADGVDVWPLLDIWANSFKIEAGFGRYMQANYDATADGEAKDLYRLFGRCVQPDRRCSSMNALWRTILRTRSLAAIRIHRRPAGSLQTPPSSVTQPAAVRALRSATLETRPYVHILFNPECAEPWMTKFDSHVPAGWLDARGFGMMDYFDVKVGVVPVKD